MTSKDLKGSLPIIVDDGGADDLNLDHVYENATENTTENIIETMSLKLNSQLLGVFLSHR
jgi:hypothetical protein